MARGSAMGGTSGKTLTVTLTEDLTIDDRDYGSIQSVSIPSIVDVTRRIVTVTTTEATVLSFGAAIGAGTYIVGDVRYMRFTNLDDTNHVILTFANEYSDEFAIKVDKGHSFIVIADAAGGLVDMTVSNQGALQFTDSTVDTSSGAYTATCDSSKFIKVGQGISGTGIAADTTVATVNTPGAVTSFTMSNVGSGTETNTTATFTGGLGDISSITAQADQTNVDLEIYIAGQ